MAMKVFGSYGALKLTIGAVAVGLMVFCWRRGGKEKTRSHKGSDEDLMEDDLPYLARMESICRFAELPPNSASKVLDFLYLGGANDAARLDHLKELGITHVCNCAAGYTMTGPSYYGDSFKYFGFEAEDDWGYDIMQHFNDTFSFIEDARKSGGKVLIHCQMGVNRSGALATAYVMVHKNIGPLSAARLVREARKLILTNDYFQRQLITVAKERNLLHLDKGELQGAANM